MILGIGIDLLDKNRVEKLYNKYNTNFINRVLSKEEILIFDLINENKKVTFLSKRFSAKESLLKAIGIGLGRGIIMKDISILNDKLGKPCIIINNEAKNEIKNIFNLKLNNIKFDISITDEKNLINTVVIISEY